MKKACRIFPVIQKYYNSVFNFSRLVRCSDFNDAVAAVDATLSEIKAVFNVCTRSFNNDAGVKALREKHAASDILVYLFGERNRSAHDSSFNLSLELVCDIFRIGFVHVNKEYVYECDELTSVHDASGKFFSVFDDYPAREILFAVEVLMRNGDKTRNIVYALKEGINEIAQFISELMETEVCTCGKCRSVKGKADKLFYESIVTMIAMSYEGIRNHEGVIKCDVSYVLLGCKDGKVMETGTVLIPFDRCVFDEPPGNINEFFRQTMYLNLVNVSGLKSPKNNIMYSVIRYYDDCYTLEHYLPVSPASVSRMMKKYARLIESDSRVKAIINVYEMTAVFADDLYNVNYVDREKYSFGGFLAGEIITRDLKYKKVVFDEVMVNVPVYIRQQLDDMVWYKIYENDSRSHLYPIIKAFSERGAEDS